MYSDLYLQKPSRMPSILAALALFVGVGATSFYFLTQTSAPTRASKKTVKQNEVVNMSARQFGLLWQAEQPDQGWIMYGEDATKLTSIALDERDTSDHKAKKSNHFALLKDLKADTQYYYKIVSNDELISAPGDVPFSVKTPREALPSAVAKPAYGKVTLTSGEPAQQAIVVIHYKDAYPLVTLTGATGEWLVPLQGLVSKNDNQPSAIQSKDLVTIEIMDEGVTTSIDAIVSNVSPLPQTVILGKQYKFMEEIQVLPASTSRSPASKGGVKYEIDIRFPKDGAVIPGKQPLIRGVGLPGKEVLVNIDSHPLFSTKVIVDSHGDWRVVIPQTVMPGRYTLTMTTEDQNGKKVGKRSTFAIAKSGEQVLAEATGSATLTPTQGVTGSPSPTSAVTSSPTPTLSGMAPTASPSAGLSITLAPSGNLTPALSLTPTGYYAYAAATPVPPVSGVSVVPYVFAGFGMVVAGAGLMLLL